MLNILSLARSLTHLFVSSLCALKTGFRQFDNGVPKHRQLPLRDTDVVDVKNIYVHRIHVMKMQHGKITIGMCAIAPGTADDVSQAHTHTRDQNNDVKSAVATKTRKSHTHTHIGHQQAHGIARRIAIAMPHNG